MLSAKQSQFIQERAKTEYGHNWLEIFKTLVNDLYSSKGIAIEDIRPRQIAAELLEKHLIQTIEVADQDIRPALNNEYK